MFHKRDTVKNELAQLQKKMLQTRKKVKKTITNALDNERKRVAQDLHDSIGQTLFSLLLELKLLKKSSLSHEHVMAKMDELEVKIKNLMNEVKDIAIKIRPSSIEEIGFIHALNHLVEQMNLIYSSQIELNYNVTTKLSPTVETAIYRICQESLFNAIKHAYADRIVVNLNDCGLFLDIEVSDNGVGFHYDSFNDQKKLGLQGMKERAMLIGGTFSVISKIGKGSTIKVNIPK